MNSPQATTIPAEARSTTSAHRHQPELDGIRGLAILAVMLSHVVYLGVLQLDRPHSAVAALVAYLLVPGWGGVDLFFALSGFLITGILLRARRNTTYFSSFYARRVLRIFPIYYLTLTLSLVAGMIWPAFGAHLPATATQRTSYFFYLQNWPVFWTSWSGITSLWGVFWSLAVEEQFYLVWPTLVRLMSMPVMLGLCVTGFLLGAPFRWWMIQHFTGATAGLLGFPLSRLDGLFIGAACALYLELRGQPPPLRWAAIAFSAGAAMLLYIGAFHRIELFGLGWHICTFGVTGFGLMAGGLVAASQHHVRWLGRILTVRPLLLAGRCSYGMYVYHLFVYFGFAWLARRISPATGGQIPLLPALLFLAAAMAVTTGTAALSFHYFEQPFLRLKRFFPSPSALVAP